VVPHSSYLQREAGRDYHSAPGSGGRVLSKQLYIVCEKGRMNLRIFTLCDLVSVAQIMSLEPSVIAFLSSSQWDCVERLRAVQKNILGGAVGS
jgi:hypothetical protein